MLSCFSHAWLFVTPWTVAGCVSLSIGFSRPEYWSGLLFPSPGDLSNPGIKPHLSPALAGWFFTTSAALLPGRPVAICYIAIDKYNLPCSFIRRFRITKMLILVSLDRQNTYTVIHDTADLEMKRENDCFSNFKKSIGYPCGKNVSWPLSHNRVRSQFQVACSLKSKFKNK